LPPFVSRVLFVSKPLVLPWNDSSKNLVRDLALGLRRYDAVAFGRRGGPSELGRARIEPLHPRERSGFHPGLRENARVMARLLAGDRTDAWHFFFAPNPKTSTVARLLARARRVPSVQTVCSVPADDADLERVLFGDRIVVLSRHTERRFLAAGVARDRLIHIPPAVPPLEVPRDEERRRTRVELGLDPERPLLLYPGDLEFGRAAALMVEAHAELASDVELALACRAKTPHARGVEAGLRARTLSLGTADRVHFIGETTKILALLAASDIVALPSTVAYAKMDYPLVLLEAMALERPVVVASDTPAAELADGGGALAVSAEPRLLAATLRRLFAAQAERLALGRAGRAAARGRFDRGRMAEAYELLYDELLAG
jgi:phosphatidylinositol alpha-1,6-mannosyltransferase